MGINALHPLNYNHRGHLLGYIVWYADDYSGYIYEHRYVMEQVLGRTLKGNEVVHHLNHERSDNRVSNLVVLTRAEHAYWHQIERSIDRCLTAKEFYEKKYPIIKKEIHKTNTLKNNRCILCNSPITEKAKYCVKCGHIIQRHVTVRPSQEKILQDIAELKNVRAVGRKYNVTDNTIRKWLRSYGMTNDEIKNIVRKAKSS